MVQRRPIHFFHLACNLGAALAIGCAPKTSPSAPRGDAALQHPVEVKWVPEGEPFAAEFRVNGPAVAAGDVSGFDLEWTRIRGEVASQVSAARSGEISRWAKTRTLGVQLPPGWIEHVALRPVGSDASGQFLLFAMEPHESSVILPTHNPLVRRRLVLGAILDRHRQVIDRVYVTIGGWVEEKPNGLKSGVWQGGKKRSPTLGPESRDLKGGYLLGDRDSY